MIYTAILREVKLRLEWQTKPGRLLAGLKLRSAGDMFIDAVDDLPMLSIIDITGQESDSRISGTLTMFLRTRMEHGWLRTNADAPHGLADWVERVQDAIERKPSNGEADVLLTAHRPDGRILHDEAGAQIELSESRITWSIRMAQLTEMSYMMQLDLGFVSATARVADRRLSGMATDEVGDR